MLAIGSHGSGAELNTTMRNIAFAAAATVSAVDAQAGDRLVFRFGYSDAAGTTPEAQATWGGSHANGIDLPVNESTTTNYNPWVEFSQDLIFELGPTALYDPGVSSTLTLNGSNVATIVQSGGSATTAGFSQGTDNNRPVLTTVGGKTVMNFTSVFANWDALFATAGDNAVLYPYIGHYTVIAEFMCTDLAVLKNTLQVNTCSGIYGHVNDAGVKFALGLRYSGSGSTFSFFSTMFTDGFANHTAEWTSLALNLWYVGTSSSRGQTISAQIDAATPITTTLAATTGVNWTADSSTALFGAGSAVGASAEQTNFSGNMRRLAIFPRYLNELEAGLARQTYFASDASWGSALISIGQA